MRQLSPEAAQAILAQQTEQVFLVCLTLTHPGMETIRIVNNTQPITRTAGEYVPYPFEAVLPEDTDSAQPTVQLRIDNVDREVTRRLRDLNGIPKCTLEVVLADSPDVVEVGPYNFALLHIEYDALVITGTLGYEDDYLNQAVPAQTYSPTNSPGLYV